MDEVLFGPWFAASFDSEAGCAGCGSDIYEDDMIRADGTGGWLCEECGSP